MVPTAKQFYIQLKKDEENLVLFCRLPCLRGVVCYTYFLLSGGKRTMFLLAQK